MLAIRMQRTGRRGYASFRVVVQDSRQTPVSGKFVAMLGSYDPHTKIATLTKDKADFYLKHGARPSERVARLFKQEGIALPNWVKLPSEQTRNTRNPEKLRKNRPGEPESASDKASVQTAETTEEVTVAETTADQTPEDAQEPEQKNESEEDAQNDHTPEADKEAADDSTGKTA